MANEYRYYEVEYALQDPGMSLAPIFRPLYRGRRPSALVIDHKHDGLQLRFYVELGLDSRDQSVLLGAIGLAGMLKAMGKTRGLSCNVADTEGRELWGNLKPAGDAITDRAIVLETSRNALLLAAGLDSKGRNYKLLEDCLLRLSKVYCRARGDGYDWSMRWLSYIMSAKGQLLIALNPRFAKALSGQYDYISLKDRRALRSDAAQIAHAWISGWLHQGKVYSIRLDKLAEKVWGPPCANPATNRKRRERINKPLQDIGLLEDWQVSIQGTGASAKALIKRPTNLVRRGLGQTVTLIRPNSHAHSAKQSRSFGQTVTF